MKHNAAKLHMRLLSACLAVLMLLDVVPMYASAAAYAKSLFAAQERLVLPDGEATQTDAAIDEEALAQNMTFAEGDLETLTDVGPEIAVSAMTRTPRAAAETPPVRKRSASRNASGSEEDWNVTIYYVDEENNHYVKETDTFSLKYQVEMHFDRLVREPGAVKIVIPAALMIRRDSLTGETGNGPYAVYADDIAVPYGTPDDPVESRTLNFNYYVDEDGNYVFWNYGPVLSGTNAAFQVLYKNLNIMDLVDGSEWELNGTVTVEGEERDLPALTGEIDSKVTLKPVTKIATTIAGKNYGPGLYTERQVNSFAKYDASGRPVSYTSSQLDFDNYAYVVWTVRTQLTATQAYDLFLEDKMNIDGAEIIGFDANYVRSGDDGYQIASKDTTRRYDKKLSFVVRYPKDEIRNPDGTYKVLTNTADVTAHPYDNVDPDQTKTDSASWTYKDYWWEYQPGESYISKSDAGDFYSWLEVYRIAKEQGRDKGDFPFTVKSGVWDYDFTHYVANDSMLGERKEGRSYEVTTADDLYYAYSTDDAADSPAVLLDGSDYYYSSVKIRQTDHGYDPYEDAETASEGYGVTAVYAVFAKDENGDDKAAMTGDDWELVATVTDAEAVYTFTEEQIARMPYHVKAVHETTDYSTNCQIDLKVRIRYDSPSFDHYVNSLKTMDNPDGTVEKVTMENYGALLWKQITRDGDGGEITNVHAIVQGEDADLYTVGHIMPRTDYALDTTLYPANPDYPGDTAGITWRDWGEARVYPISRHADSNKDGTAVNDNINGCVRVRYNLTAVDGYEIYDESAISSLMTLLDETQSATATDAFPEPGRHKVAFYDLLPIGVQYDPSQPVYVGRLTDLDDLTSNYTAWNRNQVSVSIRADDVIPNYNNTGRTMVVFHLEYDEQAAAADYLESRTTDRKMWGEGWGVSFGAYYNWMDEKLAASAHNVAAFMPDDGALTPLLGESDVVFNDDGSNPDYDFYKNLPRTGSVGGKHIYQGDPDHLYEDIPSVIFMEGKVTSQVAQAAKSEISKLVRADSDTFGEFSQFTSVPLGEGYTYQIQINTTQFPQTDIVIYDFLGTASERQASGEHINDSFFFPEDGNYWKGFYQGLNLEALQLKVDEFNARQRAIYASENNGEWVDVVPIIYLYHDLNAVNHDWQDDTTQERQEVLIQEDTREGIAEEDKVDISHPANLLTKERGWFTESEWEDYKQAYNEGLAAQRAGGASSAGEPGSWYAIAYEAGYRAGQADVNATPLDDTSVHGVAIDLGEFVLDSYDSVSFQIHMLSPEIDVSQVGENISYNATNDHVTPARYAFNDAKYFANQLTGSSEKPEEPKALTSSPTVVSQSSPKEMEVEKEIVGLENTPAKAAQQLFRFVATVQLQGNYSYNEATAEKIEALRARAAELYAQAIRVGVLRETGTGLAIHPTGNDTNTYLLTRLTAEEAAALREQVPDCYPGQTELVSGMSLGSEYVFIREESDGFGGTVSVVYTAPLLFDEMNIDGQIIVIPGEESSPSQQGGIYIAQAMRTPFAHKEYLLYKKEGDAFVPVDNIIHSTDENGAFYLHQGEKALFLDLDSKMNITVTEDESPFWHTETETYEGIHYQSIGQTDEQGNPLVVPVAYEHHTIKNTYRPVVYFSKDTANVPQEAAELLADWEFTFTLRVLSKGGETYQNENGDNVIAQPGEMIPAADRLFWVVDEAAADGAIPNKIREGRTDEKGRFRIRAGETIALFPGDVGERYEIEEDTSAVWVDGEGNECTFEEYWFNQTQDLTGSVPEAGDIREMINNYRRKYLYINKQISHQDAADCAVPFTFQILDQNGEPLAGHSVSLVTQADRITPITAMTDPETGEEIPGVLLGHLNDQGELIASDTTDENGMITAYCVGALIKVEGLYAGETYTVREVVPSDSPNGNTDKVAGLELYQPINDSLDVTMPEYGESRDLVYTNDYQKRPIEVTKMVTFDASEYANDPGGLQAIYNRAFRMRIQIKDTNGDWVPLAYFPLERSGGSYDSSVGLDSILLYTKDDGDFYIHDGETVTFPDAVMLGTEYRIFEYKDNDFVQVYPPVANQDELHEGDLQSPATGVVSGDIVREEFVNGTEDVLIIGKEYAVSPLDQGNVGADYVDLIRSVPELREQEAVTLTLEVEYSDDGVTSWEAWPASDMPGLSENDVLTHSVTQLTWEAGASQVVQPWVQIVIPNLKNGLDPDRQWTGRYRLSESQGDRYKLYAAEDASLGTTHPGAFIEITAEQGSLTYHQDGHPVAILKNSVKGIEPASVIRKRMAGGSNAVENGAQLTFEVQRYDGSAWRPAKDVSYILGTYDSRKAVLGENASGLLPDAISADDIQKTGSDGQITVVKEDRGDAVNGRHIFPQIIFPDKVVRIDPENPQAGDYRIIEIVNPDSDRDAEWGRLSSTETVDGAVYPTQTFVNANRPAKIEIQKFVLPTDKPEKDTDAVFHFELRQVPGPIPEEGPTDAQIAAATIGKYVTYSVYEKDEHNNTVLVAAGRTTGPDGVITLQDTQWAVLDVPDGTSWTVTELTNRTEGGVFDLVTLDVEGDGEKKNDNLALLNAKSPVVPDYISASAAQPAVETGQILTAADFLANVILTDSSVEALAGGDFEIASLAVYKNGVQEGGEILAENGSVTVPSRTADQLYNDDYTVRVTIRTTDLTDAYGNAMETTVDLPIAIPATIASIKSYDDNSIEYFLGDKDRDRTSTIGDYYVLNHSKYELYDAATGERLEWSQYATTPAPTGSNNWTYNRFPNGTVIDIPPFIKAPDDKIYVVKKLNHQAFTGGYNKPWMTDGSITVSLPDTLVQIGDRAFSGSTFTGIIDLPNVTMIENAAFSGIGKNYTGGSVRVRLYEGLKTIGPDAFTTTEGHTSLVGDLYLPSTLTSIGSNAFKYAGFDGTLTVNCKPSLVSNSAFSSATRFTTVEIGVGKPEGSTAYALNSGTAFANNRWRSVTDVYIGKGITSVGSGAMAGFSNVTVHADTSLQGRINANAFGSNVTIVYEDIP